MSDLSLHAHVVQLATLREELKQRSDAVHEKRAAFDATIADELVQLEALKRRVESDEAAVRGLACVAYDLDPTKNPEPVPGITIDVTPIVTIADREAAFAWSKASSVGFIAETFDEKKVLAMFTGKRPKMQPLPFVAIAPGVPKVSIARDLLAALGDVQERAV